ncbi:amidohydrolase [Spelaeicoccus albus]|uniref:Hippurate hydrolase n=1 Tax=Spelaeicoccus albus TaxID=1280376 RepID=A0A7Z0AAX6_9MICO|nr:amidohydrolase [Spelaeicoccus albus]NYI66298.1 hippurate hydrolase [Spelaeicoccus albus]
MTLSAAERTRALLADSADDRQADIVDFYTDLHTHPELSMAEHRTAGKVAERLRAAGYDVTEGVGKTGVVGVLQNGEGKTVLVRGDMDALPVKEATGLDYASTRTVDVNGTATPTMHACGHDVHTTCLVATAELLAAHLDSWSGTLVICAQPAEETAEGALAMVDDGLMTRFPRPDVCLGQHVMPGREGTVMHKEGIVMSAAANVDVTIHGRGGHGSQPEFGVDPVAVGAYLVTRLQTIVSREFAPSDPAVLSVTMFHAGSKANVIPNEAVITMNIRVRSDRSKDKMLAAIRRIADAECLAAGCPAPPDVTTYSDFPVTVNDADVVRTVRAAHEELEGGAVIEGATMMGSEDFSELGIPGPGRYDGAPIPYAYWFLGITDPRTWDAAEGDSFADKVVNVPGNHTDKFAPSAPEPTLSTGVRLLTSAALGYL